MMRRRQAEARPNLAADSDQQTKESLVLCENIHIQGFSLSLFAYTPLTCATPFVSLTPPSEPLAILFGTPLVLSAVGWPLGWVLS